MSSSRTSTNSLTRSTKISPRIRSLISYPDNLRAQGLRVVPFLRTPLREVCPLLQNPRGLLRPDGAPPETYASQGHVGIDHVESC